jgi:hypothetical protein
MDVVLVKVVAIIIDKVRRVFPPLKYWEIITITVLLQHYLLCCGGPYER